MGPGLAGLAVNYPTSVPTTYPTTPHEQASEYGEERASGLPLNSSSGALEQFHVIKAGPGSLYGISVYSNKAAAQFIQLFDALGAPASGAVPVAVYTVSATSNLGLYWGSVGRWFDRGIVIANSSTAATQTAGSGDCYFDAQYI